MNFQRLHGRINCGKCLLFNRRYRDIMRKTSFLPLSNVVYYSFIQPSRSVSTISSINSKQNDTMLDYEQNEIELQRELNNLTTNNEDNMVEEAHLAQQQLEEFMKARRLQCSNDREKVIDFVKYQHKDSFRIVLDAYVKVTSMKQYADLKKDITTQAEKCWHYI